MELTINGEAKAISEKITTVADLLDDLEVKKEAVVVEHNLKILKRDHLSEAVIRPGDSLEIIRFVGGGHA